MERYNLSNIVTIDCGKNIAYYYNPLENKKESIKVSHADLLELPSKVKNTLIVSESAHLDRPRHLRNHLRWKS